MADQQLFFGAVQWHGDRPVEIAILPAVVGDAALVMSLQLPYDEACMRVQELFPAGPVKVLVDGERDKQSLEACLHGRQGVEVSNAAASLMSQWSARGMVSGHLVDMAAKGQLNAEANARAIRLGWRTLEGCYGDPTRDAEGTEDFSFELRRYVKRVGGPNVRVVLEIVEISCLHHLMLQHGVRLDYKLWDVLRSGPVGALVQWVTPLVQWATRDRLALVYWEHEQSEYVSHALGTLESVRTFLSTEGMSSALVELQLSYFSTDATDEDEGWNAQSLLEAAIGLKQARYRLV